MMKSLKSSARRFLRDTRGGATSIVVMGVIIMTLGGAALIVDHNHLVGQRDILKSAADAASLAATLEMNKLPTTMSEEDVRNTVAPVAQKYAVLNVLGNVSDPNMTEADVSVTFEVDQSERTVGTIIEADTGSTLIASWLYNYFGPGTITVGSGVARPSNRPSRWCSRST